MIWLNCLKHSRQERLGKKVWLCCDEAIWEAAPRKWGAAVCYPIARWYSFWISAAMASVSSETMDSVIMRSSSWSISTSI